MEDPVASVIEDFSSTLGMSEVTLQLVIGAIGLCFQA